MSKVFLVSQGDYSDYHIVAAFSTHEKAERHMALMPANDWYSKARLEEMELDTTPDVPVGHKVFEIVMDEDGAVVSKSQHEPESLGFHFRDKRYGCFRVTATDLRHAVKIANEKRTQLLAFNQWGKNPAV